MFTGNDDNTTNILSRGIGPGEQRAGANETHVKNVATNPRVNDPKMDLKRMHINDDDMETNLDDMKLPLPDVPRTSVTRGLVTFKCVETLGVITHEELTTGDNCNCPTHTSHLTQPNSKEYRRKEKLALAQNLSFRF